MALNIVELINQQLGQDQIQDLSTWLGEQPDAIRKALSVGIPGLLKGLTQAVKNNENAASLLSTLETFAKEPDPHTNFRDAIRHEDSSLLSSGQKMLDALLPDQLNKIVGAVSQFSGMGRDSVNSLLQAVMPFVMSVIGRQQSDLGLDASGLQKLLDSQQQHVQASLPDQIALTASDAKSGSFGKTLVWIVIIAVTGWVLWQWLQPS